MIKDDGLEGPDPIPSEAPDCISDEAGWQI